MFACNKTGPFCLLLLDYPVFTLSYLTSFHLLAAKFFSLISPKKFFHLFSCWIGPVLALFFWKQLFFAFCGQTTLLSACLHQELISVCLWLIALFFCFILQKATFLLFCRTTTQFSPYSTENRFALSAVKWRFCFFSALSPCKQHFFSYFPYVILCFQGKAQIPWIGLNE